MIETLLNEKSKQILNALQNANKFPAGLTLNHAWTGAVAMTVDREVTLDQIVNGYCDMAADCGIDLVTESEDSITLWQGKSQSSKVSVDTAVNLIERIDETLSELLNGKCSKFNPFLVDAFYSKSYKTKSLKIVLCVNNNYTNEQRKEILEKVKLKNAKEAVIIDPTDVIKALSKDSCSVDFKIKLANPKKKIECPDYEARGIKKYFAVISGSSLKKAALETNNSKDLYSSNLRMQVKDNKIDKQIQRCIDQTPDLYNLFSNGLVIICEHVEFLQSGEVKIHKGSIANGCQQTSLIKLSEVSDKLAIDCKIITFGDCYDPDVETIKIGTCEGVNTSKKMRASDSYGNNEKLVLMKNRCAFNGSKSVELAVKRGEVFRVGGVDDFAKTSIEEMAQTFLATRNLKPAIAHNGGRTLTFEDPKLFKEVFDVENIHPNLVYDSIFELRALEKYIKESIKLTQGTKQENKWIFASNTIHFTLALVSNVYQLAKGLTIGSNTINDGIFVDDIRDKKEKVCKLFSALIDYAYKDYLEGEKKRNIIGHNKYSKSSSNYERLVDGLENYFKTNVKASTALKLAKKELFI